MSTLYDRREDPHETANLSDDAGARTLRAELLERLARTTRLVGDPRALA